MGDVKFLLLKNYLISEKTFIIICMYVVTKFFMGVLGRKWQSPRNFSASGSSPALPTLPVIRVVLVHTEWIAQGFLDSTVLPRLVYTLSCYQLKYSPENLHPSLQLAIRKGKFCYYTKKQSRLRPYRDKDKSALRAEMRTAKKGNFYTYFYLRGYP